MDGFHDWPAAAKALAALVAALVLALLWSVLASLVFLAGTGLLTADTLPLAQFWLYLQHYGLHHPVADPWLRLAAVADGGHRGAGAAPHAPLMRRLTSSVLAPPGHHAEAVVDRATQRRTEALERRAIAARPDLGLVELTRLDRHWPVTRFTAAGYTAPRHLVPDRRALNARERAQMIEELAALDHAAKPDAA